MVRGAGGGHARPGPGGSYIAPLARLVLDWDGTVTEVDSLHMVLLEFGDVGVYERAEEDLGRGLTLHEVIELEFATVRTPLAEVVPWLVENVRVRAGFAELVERFRPLVVSSGFHELIEPVLAREGVEVELRANRLDPRADGWRVRWRDEAACPVCGEPCKRGLAASLGPFAYVGDGYSDRCVALAAERVFARDGLAAYLDEQGAPYERFADLGDVAAALA
ncbi:MAG TPA: haloacid dehalogenase-like hydrolase [Gaiellaceae bacterium]|nr:haloacid dehalogenase-like hydrolase [Gaiellaceae bacterium]